jgi:hypothetical protein
VEGSCEYSIEPSGSMKYWEVLEWLPNYWVLKKGSAPEVGKYNVGTDLFCDVVQLSRSYVLGDHVIATEPLPSNGST